MKNKEEDILKRFLQDTFSDYEPEPSDITWENIRKEIQPQQPNVGAGFRHWIIPVVALLLIIGGIVFNGQNTENNTELAINSTKENLINDSQINDYQKTNTEKSAKQNIANTIEKSEKIYVNTTTSKVESKVIPKVEKSLGLPTFSTILNERTAKQNVQEYSVNMKQFDGIADKLTTVLSSDNSLSVSNNVDNVTSNQFNKIDDNSTFTMSKSENKSVEIGLVKLEKGNTKYNSKSVANIEGNNENNLENTVNHNPINDAVIEEIRYVKPLEMLKNRDFVLVKNQLSLPQISEVNINREVKPIRRPVYMSVSITPLQTYRILTVNNRNIQNLQTNNLFDSERNGWAFELGITKPIGDKWNFRSSISYLKMRQWAEYQVNTSNISVKNSNNYSNAVSVGNNDNEFIGQTRIEAKTLQMVGLKADVQRFFKITGRNRYFISGGSQLMVEPSEKQTNVFINASAGFQHLVNKDCFLTIEPTASYLLNNINDSKSLIQTNAYNLGLKVGLSFRVK
jgi:hypothetical protein